MEVGKTEIVKLQRALNLEEQKVLDVAKDICNLIGYTGELRKRLQNEFTKKGMTADLIQTFKKIANDYITYLAKLTEYMNLFKNTLVKKDKIYKSKNEYNLILMIELALKFNVKKPKEILWGLEKLYNEWNDLAKKMDNLYREINKMPILAAPVQMQQQTVISTELPGELVPSRTITMTTEETEAPKALPPAAAVEVPTETQPEEGGGESGEGGTEGMEGLGGFVFGEEQFVFGGWN